MKIGFNYQEVMDMPEADAMAFIETFASLNSPGKTFQGNKESEDKITKGKTYKVIRNKK